MEGSFDRKMRHMDCNTTVVIGASTGGPKALQTIIAGLPWLDACILIIQQMPASINESVLDQLALASNMDIFLAEDRATIRNGVIYIAPSPANMMVVNNEHIRLIQGENVNHICPSIDMTMKSLSQNPNINVVGVILTSMLTDGVEGISHIKRLGGKTIAQKDATISKYNKPDAAIFTGDVDFILPLSMISRKITDLVVGNSGLVKMQMDTSVYL